MNLGSDLFRRAIYGLAELGFVPAKLASDRRFAVAVKAMTLRTAAYLMVRDDRAGSGPISAHLWIAPRDFPDDGLDNLGVGFKTLLFQTYEELSEVGFEAIAGRCRTFMLGASELAGAVDNEIDSPLRLTKRRDTYDIQVAAFAKLQQLDNELLHRLLDFSTKRREAGASLEVSQDAARALLMAGFSCELGEELLAVLLLRHAYVEALLAV